MKQTYKDNENDVVCDNCGRSVAEGDEGWFIDANSVKCPKCWEDSHGSTV